MGTLVDRINAAAAGIKSAPRGFESRLPPAVREQLLEIRRQWQSGELQVSACWLADQIVAFRSPLIGSYQNNPIPEPVIEPPVGAQVESRSIFGQVRMGERMV